MKTIGWICLLLGILAAAIAFGAGCYPGRDCKPGQACWQDCATNPGGPGCADQWQPIPIEAKPDGGTPK